MTSDAGPEFRLWPPVSVGAPLVVGLAISAVVGDPLHGSPVTTGLGWFLIAVFVLWNGWALWTIGTNRTALLPGQVTTTLIESGPFTWSRNPLYVGLLAGSAGLSLLAASLWALVALPLEWALLHWGAVLPEERYLAAKFGDSYAEYTRKVRRWL
jgi:protein-S-isoprenylcysteine O-methyltransferase Ste14